MFSLSLETELYFDGKRQGVVVQQIREGTAFFVFNRLLNYLEILLKFRFFKPGIKSVFLGKVQVMLILKAFGLKIYSTYI